MSDLYFPGLDTAPSRLHPYFGGSMGMASPSSALNRTSHPLPSGEKAEELYLQAVKQSNYQVYYCALLSCPVLLGEFTGALSLPPQSHCCWGSLCPFPLVLSPPCWAPVQAATSVLSLCQGGRAVPQTTSPKEKFGKGNFNEHLLFHSLPPFTKKCMKMNDDVELLHP